MENRVEDIEYRIRLEDGYTTWIESEGEVWNT